MGPHAHAGACARRCVTQSLDGAGSTEPGTQFWRRPSGRPHSTPARRIRRAASAQGHWQQHQHH
eukprot:6554867-Pyramimonas_sp.AAC.1